MLSFAARSFSRRCATPVPVAKYAGTMRKYSSTAHESDAELLEREKRRNLSGGQRRTSAPIEDAPGWNEYLATTSEANVKADRSTTPIVDLQEKTISHLHSRHHPDERPEATGATYVRDEVAGPLGSAEVGEFEEDVDSDLGNVDSDGRTVTRRIIREEKVEIKK